MQPTGAPGDPAEAPGLRHLALPVRRRWLVGVLGVGVVLALVSAALQLAKGRGWEQPSLQLDRILNVDEDLSLMNWLSASTFLLAAVVAAGVAAAQRPRRLVWLAVAAVLSLISLDEAVQVHDPLQARAESQLQAGGWRAALVVLIAGTACLVVARNVLRLAPPVRWRVAGAMGLVVLAAVGIDSLGPDLVDDPAGRLKASYVARSSLEELLELAAAVLVLDGMLAASFDR